MNRLFEINDATCVKCGACAASCPVRIIGFKPGSRPVPLPFAAKACISCGHCVAVCPTASLNHSAVPLSECEPLSRNLPVSREALAGYFKSRRSIRAYKNSPVDRAAIEELISLARRAPTGHNSQSVSWLVLTEPSKIAACREGVLEWMRKSVADDTPLSKALGMKAILAGSTAGTDFILRGAPCVIVTYGRAADRLAPTSAVIALAHLELAALSFNLGACWAGFLDLGFMHHEPLRKMLPLPEGHVPCCSMMLGHPKYTYHRVPPRRKPPIIWD